MLASIIFVAVAVIAGINAHPASEPKDAPPDTDKVVAVECKYWTLTEKCLMNNMRKYKSEYDFEKDVHMTSHHHMMKQDNDHEPCLDRVDWWVSCPKSPAQLHYCNDLDTDGNAMNLKNCRYSCKECGEGAFLTAERKYKSDPTNECAEFAHHYPYHCVKPAIEMEVQLAHITAIFTPDATNCAARNIDYCVEFEYRRRGSQTPEAKKFTEFKICEQTSDLADTNELDVLHEEVEPTCAGVPDAQKYDENDNCVYDTWFRATYQFSSIAMGSEECDHARRIILEVERGVDFFDIDNFFVYEGLCHNNAGDNLTPGNPINVETIPK